MDWNKEIKIPRPSFGWLRSLPRRLRSLLNRGPSVSTPSLRVPSIKSPSIKGPSLKRPKALSRGPQIKMPLFVSDLFGDLRDRHLLPLVVFLIAAIVAAPVLLGNKSDKTEPAAPATASGVGGQTSTSAFTVVPAARHLRSPEKRLGHRQALNPFRVDTKAAEAAEASEGTEGAGKSGGSGSASGGNEVATAGSTSGGSTSSGSAGAEGSTSSPEHSSSSTKSVTVQVNVVNYRAEIKAGFVPGELAEEKTLAPMAKLPTAKDPVVLFTGLTQDHKRALFLMTSQVTGYYGDVHCAIDTQACQMVELEPGHAAIFTYGLGEEEKRYKIVLQRIVPVMTTAESASAKTVEKTTHERPAQRDSAIAQARSFSK